jgi:hypothetical protein
MASCRDLQEGWLSASGRLFSRNDDTVEIAFDTFWLDVGSTKLRPHFASGKVSKNPHILDAASM